MADDNNKQVEIAPEVITSLVNLVAKKPKKTVLHVEYDNETIALEVEILSHADWMALAHEVPHPERIQSGMSVSGPTYDILHPDYQQALRQRNYRIAVKRLARCILADIPGESNDQKADWLHANMQTGILQAINNALIELHEKGDATVKRATFQPNGQTPTTDNGKS